MLGGAERAAATLKRKGWFVLNGIQSGDRTVEQQTLGLEGFDFTGKAVLDLGCAEGLLSRYVLQHGARLVHGVDIIGPHLKVATMLCKDMPAQFWKIDLRQFAVWHEVSMRSKAKPLLARYDVVLLLSIVHKLNDPLSFLDYVMTLSSSLIVRLPARVLNDKRSGYLNCDIPEHLVRGGFNLVAEPRTCMEEWMGVFQAK